MQDKKLRNIAIIAHVDHGKTTLVDQLLKQSGVYRENQTVTERVMDSNDLERERGITILAKNTSVRYKDVKINIVDTPGHADFGGEVERILKMVDGVLLLVDAFEGPMPQTRFVLQRALELDHKVIIVVNKVDRPDERAMEVTDEALELLLDLNATDEQLDSPIIYCSAKKGYAAYSVEGFKKVEEAGIPDMRPLLDTILDHIEAPEADIDSPVQILVSSIDYNEYVGRMAVGKIERGILRQGQEVAVCDYHDNTKTYKGKVSNIYQFEDLEKTAVQEAAAGNIVSFSGIEKITIGETVCDPSTPEPLPFVKISPPTIEMVFSVNDGPFAGKEGKYVTSRNLRDRLFRELLKDVSLEVRELNTDSFAVAGRGEMHLSILIETMRREGYEFLVGTPKVLYKDIDGRKCEPIERVVIDVPQESVGAVMEKMGPRKGELQSMNPIGSRIRLELLVPARGLLGYKNEFLTDTRGEGIMNSIFDGYEPYKGDIPARTGGSLIAFETGEAVGYGLWNAQDRGILFIDPQTTVYAGMIVGVSPKSEDIVVNVCKKKHVTNTRASGSDEALRLTPPKRMSLEQSLEFIKNDELMEVTPKSIRLRKRILDHEQRMKRRSKLEQF
ncbi:MAG: translational GTPase TypA [Firmicutes bacterium]|nr:translational GTPase TypA [Bacillota bacterium]